MPHGLNSINPIADIPSDSTYAMTFSVWGKEEPICVLGTHNEALYSPHGDLSVATENEEMEYSKKGGPYKLITVIDVRKKRDKNAISQQTQDGRNLQLETRRSSLQLAAGINFGSILNAATRIGSGRVVLAVAKGHEGMSAYPNSGIGIRALEQAVTGSSIQQNIQDLQGNK